MRPDATLPALECLCASLRRASRALSQAYDAELRSTGLRSTQFTLLQVLAKKPGATQGEIGEFLALDSTTLTRTLALLVRQGFLRSRAGQDRRERLWELTAAGERKWRASRPSWERAQAQARARLGAGDVSALLTQLAQVAGQAKALTAARRGREE